MPSKKSLYRCDYRIANPRDSIDRTLWLIFLTAIVVSTHIVIVNLTLEYIVQPTEIHMAPNLVHVANSPFPAVGVCSSNMISKNLMQSYAAKM